MSILYKIPFIPLGPRPELCQWPAHHRRTGNRPAPTLYSYRMPESVISIWPKARVGTLWRYKRYKRIHPVRNPARPARSEEHTSELQSLMRTSYAVFCLKKKKNDQTHKLKIQ